MRIGQLGSEDRGGINGNDNPPVPEDTVPVGVRLRSQPGVEAQPMSDVPKKLVECSEHGPQQATYVCQHIVLGLRGDEARGFWSAADSGNPRPDAWCTACNEFLHEKGGDWNDVTEAFASVTLLCGACYDRAKAMNEHHEGGKGGE